MPSTFEAHSSTSIFMYYGLNNAHNNITVYLVTYKTMTEAYFIKKLVSTTQTKLNMFQRSTEYNLIRMCSLLH